jgi:Zinc carboxypeptidase.
MRNIKIIFILLLFYSCNTPLFTPEEDFLTPFELTNGNGTTSYEETIAFYKKLATNYGSISMKTMGETDSGIPLYLVIFNSDGTFDLNRIRKNKMIVLIANGVNADESEGIDATMQLMRNLAQKQVEIPENTVVVTIPIMNYLGLMEKESLFKNHINTFINNDLSNDFIENKSLNTRSFVDIFHQLNPHIFIDTRSLQGKDIPNAIFYQTIFPEKLGKIKYYLKDNFLSQLSDSLRIANKNPIDSLSQSRELLPYPTERQSGISSSIGYVSLWNTIGLYIATKKESPYKNRVEEMYNALKCIVLLTNSHKELIQNLQQLDNKEILQQREYILSYVSQPIQDSLNIHPLDKRNYIPQETISIPKTYIIPQLFTKVIDNFKRNSIEMDRFEKDSLISVNSYILKISKDSLSLLNYKDIQHKLTLKKQKIAVRKGDIIINTEQKGRKYLIETLEPHADNNFMKENMLFLLSSPKDSIWVYPVFSIEDNID